MTVPKITEYMDNCIICGKPAAWHHVLHGYGMRHLADEDGLVLPLCPEHHQYSDISAHVNHTVDVLCQIIGELAFERNLLASGKVQSVHDAQLKFMERYGKKFL